MRESEYIKLKQEAEREYREKLSAIEMVWKMSRQPTRQSKATGNSASRGNLKVLVKTFVNQCKNQFTIIDVENFVKPTYPDTNRGSLNNLLRKMVEDGELKQLQKSAGRAPAIYHNMENV